MWKGIVLCYIPIFISIEAAKILAVFPTPNYSHQLGVRPLIHELAKYHQVVLVTTDPAFPDGQSPTNLTEISTHDLSYRVWEEKFSSSGVGRRQYNAHGLQFILECSRKFLDKPYQTKEVQKIIKGNLHFDLVIVESFIRPLLAFSHKYKVPLIRVSSFGSLHDEYDVTGSPYHPGVYTSIPDQRIFNLTMWEIIEKLYINFISQRIYKSFEENDNKLMKEVFGADFPTAEELKENNQVVYLNLNTMWDNNRPVSPNLVYFGQLQDKPGKEIPQDIKTYLDSSKRGVIYVSFGTTMLSSTVPKRVMEILLKILSELPYDVLMKWDEGEMPKKIQNIKTFKWLPQRDILKHPNVKLYIMQGGLQSTDDAIIAGVPLVGIPFLVDQWYNTERYIHHGVGNQIDVDTVTEEELRNAIITVLEDKSYKRAMLGLREVLRDQTSQALQRGVARVLHVLRHGAQHTRAPAAHMPLYQYLEIELLIIVIFTILAIICFNVFVLYKLIRYTRRFILIKKQK